MSYTSNRLHFMLLMSLGASRSLRRVWFWGCVVMLAVAGAVVYASGYSPTYRTGNDLMFYIGTLLGIFSLMGLGVWIVANVIRFVGKHVKDDYRDNELFERWRTIPYAIRLLNIGTSVGAPWLGEMTMDCLRVGPKSS